MRKGTNVARTRKKATDPVQVERDGVKVTVETERTSPDAPAPAKSEPAPKEKAPRRPRARKQPAPEPVPVPVAVVEAPMPEPVPVPVPVPVPAEPPQLPGLADLLAEAQSLRQQLGDAGRQAEETRLLLQSVRHQHEELTRQLEARSFAPGAPIIG